MFSDNIVEEYRSKGRSDLLKRIEHDIKEHDDRYIKMIKPFTRKPKNLLGRNGLYYLQNVLFRSRVLIEGSIFSLNSENILVTLLATRAHYEITGSLAYFLKKLKSYYEHNITFEQVNETLHKLSIGGKLADRPMGTPEAIGVMSMIDAADDLFKQIAKEKITVFRESYEYLSEFCHPNHYGVTMGSHLNSIGIVRFDKHPDLKNKYIEPLGYLTISTGIFIMYYDKILKYLTENEDMPVIVR